MTVLADLTAADYHADTFADQPTLSASIAHLLCTRSPAHAREAHPKLNPRYERKVDDKFSVGTVAHAMLLEGRDIVQVIHEPSYRTKDAKEQRDHAYSVGKIPLLFHHVAEVEAMVDAVWVQLAEHQADPALFADGAAEQTIVWQEGDVTCKARLDWLRHDLACIDDLKCTSRAGGADPAAFARALFGVGYDVKAAFYLRGLRAVRPDAQPLFRWVVVETAAPNALSVVTPSPAILDLGNAKVDSALKTWRRCMESGEWPAYPPVVTRAEAPSWEVDRWLDREDAQAA